MAAFQIYFLSGKRGEVEWVETTAMLIFVKKNPGDM
jgi:hypothetical protein